MSWSRRRKTFIAILPMAQLLHSERASQAQFVNAPVLRVDTFGTKKTSPFGADACEFCPQLVKRRSMQRESSAENGKGHGKAAPESDRPHEPAENISPEQRTADALKYRSTRFIDAACGFYSLMWRHFSSSASRPLIPCDFRASSPERMLSES